MKSFRFWAKYEGTLQLDGTTQPAVFLGGSNLSEEDARQAGRRKCAALQRKIEGERHGFDDYEVEIREEQVADAGEGAVITRNRYGAHVLNTEHLMILDVDEPPAPFFRWFSRKAAAAPEERLRQAVDKLRGKLGRPVLGFRLYRTCRGFRVIVTGEKILPSERLAHVISRKLHTDPLYWMLCEKQRCYRARLTPKPYRMKHPAIQLRLPEALERREEIAAWEQSYLEKAKSYSVCRYLGTLGAQHTNPLVDLHDRYTGAQEGKELA